MDDLDGNERDRLRNIIKYRKGDKTLLELTDASKIMESTLGRGNAFRRFYEYVFTHPFAAEIVLDNILITPRNWRH